jgi:hypothetical protein
MMPRPTKAQRRVLDDMKGGDRLIRVQRWAGPNSIRITLFGRGEPYQDVRYDTFYAMKKYGWLEVVIDNGEQYPQSWVYALSAVGKVVSAGVN